MIRPTRAQEGHAQPNGLFDDRFLHTTLRRRSSDPDRSPGGSPALMGRRGRGRGRHPRAPRPAVRRFVVADEARPSGSAEAARLTGWLLGAREDDADRGRAIGRGGDGGETDPSRSAPPSAQVEVDRPAPTAEVAAAPAAPAAAAAAAPSGIDPGTTVRAGRHRRGDDREAESDEVPRARGGRSSCSQSQMRRFIKSRIYVPLHELRRRFAIDGVEDDVAHIEVEGRGYFVGLPQPEAEMLRELIRSGEVGMELLLDPESPVIVGVFPMRPVPRA